ncbi:MAG TPA: EAL domain-containing protein [Rhodocyclaceae bacterium]|nr:EAL domain-containing protein [Rhodocyclaceae bacterium]
MSHSSDSLFLGRQPILDRKQELFAYELLFRDNQENSATVDSDLAATANVISHAFGEIGIEQALGPYKGFINCDAALLLSDLPELLPPGKIVLEVLETVEITPEIVERCTELKRHGFMIALDDFTHEVERWRPMLLLTDIVKVDLKQLDRHQLLATTQLLKNYPLRLLAEKVDSREVADVCKNLGYDFFQGYYFARPAMLTGQKLGQSQAALMRLLALVLQDAETGQLEDALKQQPGLAFNLLRLTNSVATGIRMKVTSLRHAITVLGRRQLQRWLQLVIYTNPDGKDFPSPLMHLAATRGRLIELLAARIKPGDKDFEGHAFLTGIMSLMPALLGTPMSNVLQGLPLDSSVTEALLNRSGELGALLSLAESLESHDTESSHLLAQRLGLLASTVNSSLALALAWASNIGVEVS